METEKQTHISTRTFWTVITIILIVMAPAAGVGGYYLAKKADSARPWDKIIQTASQGNATLASTFAASHGLQGLIIKGSQNNSQRVGWGLDGDEPIVIVGQVFNESGENITVAAHKEHIGPIEHAASTENTSATSRTQLRRPDSAQGVPRSTQQKRKGAKKKFTPAQMWRGVKAAQSVTLVDAPQRRTMFVFADPNCPYCHKFYQQVVSRMETLGEKNVGVAWVPVATLSKTSAGKAAAILAGGKEALAVNETQYDRSMEQGGIQPDDAQTRQRQVYVNTMLMLHDGHTAVTPTIVWKEGDDIHIHPGKPSEDTLDRWVSKLSKQQ